MIAHSLKHDDFGKAKNLHGATLIIQITFFSKVLDDKNTVLDIVFANDIIDKITGKLDYQNLDELSEFDNQFTTIEYLSEYIFTKIKDRIDRSQNIQNIEKIKVTIHENSEAWASFEDGL